MFRLCKTAALVGAVFAITCNAASGDVKDEANGAKPFQTNVTLQFGETGARAEGVEVAADNRTIVLQYVSCSMSRSPSSASDAAFQVYVYDQDGYTRLVLDSAMDLSNSLAPGFGGKPFHGNAFVQACAGKKCENLEGIVYDGFALEATRADPNREEQMQCLLSGMLYE